MRRLLRPDNAPFSSAIVLAVAALAAFAALRAQSSTSYWVLHTYEVMSELQRTMSGLTEAQGLQRAYARTRQLVDPDRVARLTTEVGASLATLKHLTADNPAQQQRLRQLDDVVDLRIDASEPSVGEAAREAVPSDPSAAWRAEQLDVARQVIDEMTAEERHLLESRLRDANRASWAGGGATAATGALALALLFAMQRATARHTGQLERANAALASQAAELEHRVQARTADLADANATLQAYAQTIAHDLRAPLRNMQGFATALLEDDGDRLSAEGRDHARRISAAAVRLDGMITDLLAYSRLSQQRLALAPVPLGPLVAEVVAQSAAEIARSGAVVDVAPDLPVVVAHRETPMHALDNVLANALKFVAPGEAPRVAVRARRADGRVLLDVEDHGIGIAPAHQERIFAVFERLHGADRYPGSGIGLAIAKKALERMRGALRVTSVEGAGTTFTLELEAAPT